MSALKDGGPAFPTSVAPEPMGGIVYGYAGMTLRDYFATQAPTDEVQELNFRHLSRMAQERITGLSYPKEPRDDGRVNSPDRVAFQLEEFRFKCAVNAAIRFALADAMLAERAKVPG